MGMEAMTTPETLVQELRAGRSMGLADEKDEPRTAMVSSRDVSPRPSHMPRNPEFQKSASYTYLPNAKDSAYGSAASLPNTLKGSFSEDDLITPLDSADGSPHDSSGWTTPLEDTRTSADMRRDLVEELHKSPKIKVSQVAHGNEDDPEVTPKRAAIPSIKSESVEDIVTTVPPKARVHESSFARRFSRRIAVSRSPSPSKRKGLVPPEEARSNGTVTPQALLQTRKKSILKKKDGEKLPAEVTEEPKTPSRKGTLLRRKSSRRSGSKAESTSFDERRSAPAVPFLPKSFSTDRLPSLRDPQQEQHTMPMPRIVSGERATSFGSLAMPRKKDELWSVFRTLEADYAKFTSKSTSLKANVVRSSLLPFLRNYSDHASNRALRPEDLDRRTNILNKWWTGLLEMLHGKNNQSLSGTDRPAILDALSGLMDRSEWRLSPSPYCPVRDRSNDTGVIQSKSSVSLASTGVDFLTESVLHNTRNIFVQNLNAQMSFVVDKMSLRNASASLVTFCGKATAYAFFYCPGIADVLVRLWAIPADTLKRVLSESGVGKFDDMEAVSGGIASAFPPPVQPLAFSSLPKMMRVLRRQPPLPLGTANIQWYGFWLERWLGRESDLFYAFVKHYHILVTDYLPADATEQQRICVPGLVLVHAQILTNLDSTIHRETSTSTDLPGALSPTFDDLLGEPDAVASTLPLPPANAVRIMAENRLIMLIRDFLSERTNDHPIARHLFAVSFNKLLHACARKTSMYDHSACYTLCDFLEEALLLLVRYEHLHSETGPLIDSGFWLNVFKRMITSQNTMTETRLYAFLFSVWSIMCSSPVRKSDICLGFLLEEAVFDRTFNHWCPMVRAYYMRLLCWRVGRYDGEASETDIRILEKLSERLRGLWSYFLFIKDQAERNGLVAPSTTPSNPAPSRRLLIVRTDTQIAPGGSFLAFNGVLPPNPPTPLAKAAAEHNRRTSTLSQVINIDPRPSSSQSSDDGLDTEREPGLRGFLRGIMGSSRKRSQSRSASRPSSSHATPVPSPPNGLELARSATDDGRLPRTRSPAPKPPLPAPPHRNFCFKFSLEFSAKAAAHPPGNMRLFPPRLPAAAQQFLQSRSHTGHSPTPTSRMKEPLGESKASTKYAGRALAEWTIVTAECQGFFERRKGEGVPGDRLVETPTLGVEVFRRSA